MQVTRTLSVFLFGAMLVARAQTPTTPASGSTVAPAGPNTTPAPAAAAAAVTNMPSILSTNPPTVVVNTRSISLQEAIDLALQHNYDVQIQRFFPDLSRLTLEGAYGAYDPTLSASGEHNYNQSPGGLTPGSNVPFPSSATEFDQFSAGLGGLTPWGLQYSLTGQATDTLRGPAGSLTNEITTANAAISQLRQPLLKNFWIDSARATILIAKNRLKYSELTVKLQIMSTVTAVEQAYYNLIFARENVKVQETALQLAERLLWENKKRVEVGQMAPLDEKQAESQAAASKADLLAAQQALDAQENILKNLITDDFTTWHPVRLIPAEKLEAVPPILDLQESWAKGRTLRPDLLQARLDVQRDSINIRFYKNQLFPELDLIGQYGYQAAAKEYAGAFGQIADRANPYWYYGATVSFPIGNRSARANYSSSKATKAQNELILKRLDQQILVQIDNAVKLVQSDFQRVDATKKAREFAQDALAAEQKKLDNGKSTSFQVLQFQRDLTAASFAEVQALANYNNDQAQLALNEGSTLDRHHLNVQVK